MNGSDVKYILENKPVECSKCGASLLYKGSGKYICNSCGNVEYDDFGKVKKFIDENGVSTMGVISEATGVSLEKLNLMLRDGKVEIPEGSKYYIKCESCGCSIRYGHFCPDCVRKTANDLNKAFYVAGMGEKPRNEGSIRFKKDEEKDMKGRGGFRSSRSSTRNSGSTSISRS